MLLRCTYSSIRQLTRRNSNRTVHNAPDHLPPNSIKAFSTIFQKPKPKPIPFWKTLTPLSNGWNTRSFSSGRMADVEEMLAELQKEEEREKREKEERKEQRLAEGKGNGDEDDQEEEKDEEEEDYMGLGEIVEEDVKEDEQEDEEYDNPWDIDDTDDEDERFSRKAQQIRKEDFDKKFQKYQDLLKSFRDSGSFDEAYAFMDRIDRFEAKHFALSNEYKVVGWLINRLKEATGKDRFMLLMKTQRALKQLEWKEAFDPQNPANWGVIKQDDAPSAEDLEQAEKEKKEHIEGQAAATDNEDEDLSDEEDKEEILRDKLRSIDKEIKKKLADMELSFGKESRELEEEIKDLVERKKSLMEKKKQPLYRKGFDAKLIDVNRTCKVTKGGQIASYTAMVVCGNFNGVVGYAKGKGAAVPVAIQRAYAKSFQNLHYVERYEEHTIPHAIQTKFKKTKIYLWPGAIGTGMRANSTIESVLYLAGYKNVKSKVIGSRHPHNTVKALFKALNMIETPKDIQEKFGRSVVESHLLK